MDPTIGRRQTVKLLGGLIVTGGLAGCTSDEAGNPDQTEGAGNGTTTSSNTEQPTATTDSTATATATQTESATEEPTSTATEKEESGKGKAVSFASDDGRTVEGTLYGSGSCAVVFAHGVGFKRSAWEPQALEVANGGHAALTVSLNHDNETGAVKTLVGAVNYLREKQSAKTVVVVGSSAGANAAVKANTVSGANIDGSVIIAPGRAAEYAPDLSGDLLFVVGEGDERQYVGTTDAMHQAAPKPKRLEKLSTDKHGQEIFDTNQGSKLTQLITEFTDTTCSG
ncbi:alpha/beta hydrolase family protein [Halocatena marina]|uniref:Alpha/beta hydrolase family protein n=1 Tax=Halocatena marina TaxID=2934937 RepID=A0ABD5YQ50_9EURY|nr:alpha/beta hydrolase [Halocatena marina]